MNQRQGATYTFKAISGVIALACMMLSGCVTVPKHLPSIESKVAYVQSEATRDWNATPAFRTEHLAEPALHTSLMPVPQGVMDRAIAIDLPPGATISDLAVLLSSNGIPTTVASDDVAGRHITLPSYSGKASGLFALIESLRNLSLSWSDGVLVIDSGVAMTASVPPSKDLIKTVSDELKALGASQIVASVPASEVSFNASADRIWSVKRYLHRVIDNSATIGLQVAVITVGLNREQQSGLDWSRLQFTLGRTLGLRNDGQDSSQQGNNGINNGNVNGSGSTGNNNGNGSGGNSNKIPTLTDLLNTTSTTGAEFAGGNFGIGVARHDFNMQALFSLLSTYGNTQTTQNLVLRSLSGGKVKIRSGATVPYVSQVNIAAAGNSNSVFGGSQTETVDTGLTLTIEPHYDAVTGRVTMDVDMQLKSIIGFLKLSAGAQIGSMTRPEVQDQSLETVARAAAGHTVVLGGILYDQLSDDRNTLPGMENAAAGHLDRKIQRNALFIVIRPTVTTYRFADTASRMQANAE